MMMEWREHISTVILSVRIVVLSSQKKMREVMLSTLGVQFRLGFQASGQADGSAYATGGPPHSAQVDVAASKTFATLASKHLTQMLTSGTRK